MAGRPIEGARLFAIILEGLEQSLPASRWGEKVNEHTAFFFFFNLTNSIRSTMGFFKMKMEKFISYTLISGLYVVKVLDMGCFRKSLEGLTHPSFT